MQLPRLTPLQSRCAASLAASAILLLLLYMSLTRPHFAYAIELDSRIPPDHNHPLGRDVEETWITENGDAWVAEALGARAPAGVSALANNDGQNMNIEPGVTQNWVLPKEVVLGPHTPVGPGLPGQGPEHKAVTEGLKFELKRQARNIVYITISTCLQPSALNASPDTDESIPPQLELFISQSASNQEPGPSKRDDSQRRIEAVGGYALATLEADDDVFIGVSAPNTTAFQGIWNYEIAASIDAPFQSAENDTNLYFVDADNHAALLITNSTTQAASNSTIFKEWMTMRPPWGMFAHNQAHRAILGVRNSFCGLLNYAEVVVGLSGVQNQNLASMTSRGADGKPKEQFYVTALNASSKYWGFLAMQGNSTASGNGVVGGGGKIWPPTNFTTKHEDNCALLYNLSFCSEVAYAVPTNPDKFPPSTGLPDLAALYDSNAAGLYVNFNYSLQQIPCNTTSTAQYSLARGCDDCARVYKQWLCAVTIPRCEDYSNPAPYLMPRNVAQPFINGSTINPHTPADQLLLNAVATNSSRNPIIDLDIRPGPYKEVLPCEDLCWDLVQSCPAALGFGCPYAGRGLEKSYGTRSQSGFITCSYLGAAYYLSAAGRTVDFTTWKMTVSILALVATSGLWH